MQQVYSFTPKNKDCTFSLRNKIIYVMLNFTKYFWYLNMPFLLRELKTKFNIFILSKKIDIFL